MAPGCFSLEENSPQAEHSKAVWIPTNTRAPPPPPVSASGYIRSFQHQKQEKNDKKHFEFTVKSTLVLLLSDRFSYVQSLHNMSEENRTNACLKNQELRRFYSCIQILSVFVQG